MFQIGDDKMEQIKFSDDMPRIEAANESHLACVLLLDTSSSMDSCIDNLNDAIAKFKNEVCKNELSRQRVDVAVIEFNSEVRVVQDFLPVTEMQSINLRAEGVTVMGQGINAAIDLVKKRNQFYDDLGTPCFKPWIFMITDGCPCGEPESEFERAKQRIKEEESKGKHGKLKFFAVAVDYADRDKLMELTNRVIELREADFGSLFNWLADSMVTISVSTPSDEAKLNALPKDARRYDPDRDVSDW